MKNMRNKGVRCLPSVKKWEVAELEFEPKQAGSRLDTQPLRSSFIYFTTQTKEQNAQVFGKIIILYSFKREYSM